MSGSIYIAKMNYLYRDDRKSALKRLQKLERVEDASTFTLLENLNILPGWKCLEMGAGAGSVALWLSNRVGVTGSVVATDLEIDLLSDLVARNISVIQHDLTVDELPQSTFDLIHARHILIHTGGDVMKHVLKLVKALKPGGWPLTEALGSVG